MNSMSYLVTNVTADDPVWEYDFRREIAEVSGKYKIATLKRELNKLMDKDPDSKISTKSMKSFCPAVSPAIPEAYEIHDTNRPAGKKAGELRRFLSEQIGRPQYEKIIRVTKRDLVELVVALRAAKDNIDRPVTAVPTILPEGAEQFIPDTAPAREQATHHPEVDPDKVIKLDKSWETHLESSISDDPWHVYEIDVTPRIKSEPEDIELLRRHAKAMERYGIAINQVEGSGESLDGVGFDR
ncbi:hypothetical protein [Haloferax prahovense]|uniref:hypothetical protein n=1 Tax=Haloferax prahovense TaxID=381852 RepID=UPI00126977B4|nr:hypothetical protein [Haloferax prahovense]